MEEDILGVRLRYGVVWFRLRVTAPFRTIYVSSYERRMPVEHFPGSGRVNTWVKNISNRTHQVWCCHFSVYAEENDLTGWILGVVTQHGGKKRTTAGRVWLANKVLRYSF